MPHSDPQARAEYQRAYWEANRERRNLQRRERRRAQPEVAREMQRLNRERHKEEIATRRRERYASDEDFREAIKDQARSWGSNNKARKRHCDRSRRYGITTEQAAEMDAVTHCEATGIELSEGRGKVIDHCHGAGTVRGVLDAKINMALGLFGHDPKALRAAADYLERTSVPGFQWGDGA